MTRPTWEYLGWLWKNTFQDSNDWGRQCSKSSLPYFAEKGGGGDALR
jgi:hypothetical protein